MRNRSLHQALLAFTEEAAFQLENDASDGAEVPFELVEAPGARTSLYCYHALTGDFIREHISALGRLPSYAAAARALAGVGGLDVYLRARGERRIPDDPDERADAVLRAFLGAVFGEASDFEFQSERFAHAYRELEGVVYEGRALAAVMVPVLGIELDSDELPLEEGFSLVRGDTLADAPAEAVWHASAGSERANVIAVLGTERAEGDSAPITAARVRFRRLLTALRLFEPGGVALGPVAWTRTDAGPWQLVVLGGSGRPRGAPWFVPAAQEDELRGFCNLIARRAPGSGEVGWALARFEMGCERVAPFEALTDYLLALRTLLEPEGPNSGRLASRLAAICAVPERRAVLTERVAHAISLERAVVAGIAPAEHGVDALVEELSEHLRALLRDMVCGHLDRDLVEDADRLLLEGTGTPQRPAFAETA
ncbi:MAG: hypothetical protein QOK04_2050 [Solirubrobacteraceae bacterium]|nr:hypothetical protein [Solirubrobacteraceae bacterium]